MQAQPTTFVAGFCGWRADTIGVRPFFIWGVIVGQLPKWWKMFAPTVPGAQVGILMAAVTSSLAV